jgi:hypothetical protein
MPSLDSWTTAEIVRAVLLAIALAACAGLRAWLPLLLAGLLARFDILQLGPSWHFLSSNVALALFGLATVIEIVGDKIPAVDHVLDALATFLRPAAGALLAASVLGFVKDPLIALALGVVVGAPSAFVPHVVKSGLRLVSSTVTFGLANPILSVIEDVLTLVLFVLALLIPAFVVLLTLGAALWATRRLLARRGVAPRPA